MMHDDGDLILVHDCDHPERIGVWERTVTNDSYQLHDMASRPSPVRWYDIGFIHGLAVGLSLCAMALSAVVWLL